MASGGVLSPALLTTFQNVYMDKFVHALSNIEGYSLSLFYLVAGIEIAVFGLVWAIRQETLFGAFFFKVLKLGILFFLISEYPSVLQVIIDGFTQVAFQLSPVGTEQLIFNPATVWRYGFDHGIQMIMVAVQYGTTNTAMSTVFLCMGFGSIVIFALIGVQIILAVVGFYVVSLVSLLLIPFGAFVGTQGFLSRSLQGVLKAGVRVFVVIFIIGVAATVWKAFPGDSITLTTKFDEPLSLFLSALIVLVLLWKLPEVTVELVGDIKGNIWGQTVPVVSSDHQSSPSSSASVQSVASGTYIPPYGNSDRALSAGTSLSSQGGGANASIQQAAVASSVQLTANGSGLLSGGGSKEMKRSSEINDGPKRRGV
jgi:P-type conjugative transfer protein TrbL